MLGRAELIFIVFVVLVVFWPFFARRAGVKRRPARSTGFFSRLRRNKRKIEPEATPVDYEELD